MRASKYLLALAASAVASIAATSHALTPEDKEVRLAIKREVFAGLEFQRAAQVAAGAAEPLLAFEVDDATFIHWRIPAQRVAAFEHALALPAGFALAKVQILPREPARYYLSLNLYAVAIAGVPGVRAEWSTYVVRDGDPKPRFLIIEARSSVDSFDPVSGPTSASAVTYAALGGEVLAQVVADGTDFSAQFELPCRGAGNQPRASQAWAEANDFIYWQNGVADKAFYDSSVTRDRWLSIDPSQVAIEDGSRWAEFVDAEPVHVLYSDVPLRFALSPWFNAGDPALALDPGQRAMLLAVKAQVYSGLGQQRGYLVSLGQAEALVDFTVVDAVPAYFINFEVPRSRVAALVDAIGMPAGLELAELSIVRGERPAYFLSLNVYQAAGVAAGMRAEWSVYVREVASPSKVYFMAIDVASSVPSFNVVDLATPPAPVFENTLEQSQITTSIVGASGSFAVTFMVPGDHAHPVRLSPTWLAANDRVYWTNGVYDKLYYNGSVVDAEVAEVCLASVDIYDDTPWRRFVRPQPAHVLVFRNAQEYLLHPWFNLEEL
jgi:hypothetical protein